MGTSNTYTASKSLPLLFSVMNSQSLQSKHSHIYENFFGQHETVISIPFIYPLRHDTTDYKSWLRCYQKLPLRLYLWRTHKLPHKDTFWDIHYYDLWEQWFITMPLFQYKNGLSSLLCHPAFKNSPYTYSFLVESQKQINFSLLKHLYLLLASLLIYSSTKKERTSDIDDTFLDELQNIITELPSHANFSIEDPLLHKCACRDWSFPFFAFSWLPWQQRALNDFFDELPNHPTSLVDQTIVYSGIPAAKNKNRTSSHSDHLEAKFIKKLENQYNNSPSRQHPPIYTHLQNNNKDVDNYEYAKRSLALKFLQSLSKIYNPTHYEHTTPEYLRLRRHRRLLDILSYEENSDVYKFTGMAYSHLGINTQYVSWNSLNPTNIGWSYLLCSPLERYRKSIKSFGKHLDEHVPDNSSIIYKSREDGIAHDGIRIEQDIDKKMYSTYIQQGYISLNKQNTTEQIGKWSLLTHSTHPFLINYMEKKIYIYGKKTTSKQLLSQSYTTELLCLLLENIWVTFSNKQLPPSSYSASKNEFIAKIIKPLQHLCLQYFDTKLPIKCTWSGFTFDVCLEHDPLWIIVAKKI